MSSCSCGASSRPSGRTPVSTLLCAGHAQQLVARRDQRRVAVAAAVLQAEGEAGRGAEFGDRRRAEREDERVAHAHQRAEGAAGQRLRRMLGALALAPSPSAARRPGRRSGPGPRS